MDKRSLILGLVFVLGGFLLMMWNSRQLQEHRQEQLEAARQQQAAEAQAPQGDDAAPEDDEPLLTRTVDTTPLQAPLAEEPDEAADTAPALTRAIDADSPSGEDLEAAASAATEVPVAEKVVLENDVVRLILSARGGAIESIVLKDYPLQNPHRVDATTPVVLNNVGPLPALALSQRTGDRQRAFAPIYRVEQPDARTVVFRTTHSNLEWVRTYRLADRDTATGDGAALAAAPYLIEHETRLRNTSDQTLALEELLLQIGLARPTEVDPYGTDLGASYHDAEGYHRIAEGILFRKGQLDPEETRVREGPILWGAVKNQFFTSILIPERPARAVLATGVPLSAPGEPGPRTAAVAGALVFDFPTLAPGESHSLSAQLYAGPKDYDRLASLGQDQENVMQLGWFLFFDHLGLFAWIGEGLLILLQWLHGVVFNWGVAIIVFTLLIRLVLYPVTARAARTSKRMQKLQKPIGELRERFKDNPQRLNEEMMKLWKKHKVNPLSGCLPVLFQIPIFISMFNLLRNSADLRFAQFLWIDDLSQPDATIPLGADLPFIGSHLNVLPFVWLVSMWYQMKLMPQPAAGADNPALKLMKYMPFIFFPFTYVFSSGLVLYWTTTNLFSIGQQYMINRIPDEEDIAIEHEIEEAETKKARKKGQPTTGPLISRKRKKKPDPGQR